MACIPLANDETATECVKEPKLHFEEVILVLALTFDQEFGANICPVLEIDCVMHRASFLGRLQKTFPVQDFKEAGKMYGLCNEVGKRCGKLFVFIPAAETLEKGDSSGNASKMWSGNVNVDPCLAGGGQGD
jgi:hypothetical protein